MLRFRPYNVYPLREPRYCTVSAGQELANPANERFLELEEELAEITRRLNDLFRFWVTLDTANHPKRRELTGDRIAEIERAEDELEETYRARFKEWLRVREQVTHLEHRRREGWVVSG